MIPWAQYNLDSEADWVRLTGQIIASAQVAVQQLDNALMNEAANDILDYAGKSSYHKPEWATTALRRAQSQLTAARQGLGLNKLKAGTDKFDAILARMTSASAELKADAARLRRKPVTDALGIALALAAEVRAVEADLDSLPKDDLAGRLSRIQEALEKLRAKLTEATD